MNLTHTPETPHDLDLLRTRRTFLFAREQVAAQTRNYAALRRTHHWAAYREAGTPHITDPDAPGSIAR
jgi:hypothetical protein